MSLIISPRGRGEAGRKYRDGKQNRGHTEIHSHAEQLILPVLRCHWILCAARSSRDGFDFHVEKP